MPLDVKLTSKNLLGDNSIVVPPDPIPNSEVKRNRADGSVGLPHVRVGHRQAPNILAKRVKSQLHKLAFLRLEFGMYHVFVSLILSVRRSLATYCG